MSDNSENSDRDSIQRMIEKSGDDFERNLTYISAGSLGLSLTFIEKIVKIEDSNYRLCLILGWIFLALTLFVNLISHLISRNLGEKSNEDLDKIIVGSEDYESKMDMINKIKRRNKLINWINYATMALLIVGISLIIIFISLNVMNKTSEVKTSPKMEQKGLTIPVPKVQTSTTTSTTTTKTSTNGKS